MRICSVVYLFLFFFRLPVIPVWAQDTLNREVAHWNAADTAYIVKLINQGIPLLYSNPDSALRLLGQAEQMSRDKNFGDGIGYALVFKGQAVAYKGNFKKGFAYYRQALPYCLNARYLKVALPSLYTNMGVSYANMGDLEQGSRYYYKALQYMQQHLPDDRYLIVVYNNISAIHQRQGNLSQALGYAERAEQLSASHKTPSYLVSALINKGAICTEMGLLDSALSCFQKGLKIAKENGYTDMQQALLTNIGSTFLQKEQPDQAIAYYQQALALSDVTNPLYGRILPGYYLGIAWYKTKEYDKAEQILQSSLKKAEATGLTASKQIAHETLSQLYEAIGRYREALAHRRLYEQLQDSITGVAKTISINELEHRYRNGQKDKQLAENRLKISEQKRSLDRNRMITTLSIAGIVLILLLTILYSRYKRKMERRNKEMMQLKAVMDGEEKERERIARELHDGIGGMLTGLTLNLNALQKKADLNQDDLFVFALRLKSISEEVHKTARNLTPTILQQHNLWQALTYYCEQFETNEGLHIDLQLMGDITSLDKSIQLTLYRIIQELVQNIARHARAKNAAVQVRRNENVLYLSAEDDGLGFDTAQTTEGLGLHHIRARVAALNGFCSVASGPGKGTAIYIEMLITSQK